MIAVLILAVIFGGIALVTYAERGARGRPPLPPGPSPLPPAEAMPAQAPETLALALPEPARSQAWALLCLLQDAERQGGSAHTNYLLAQTRQSYLPDTLRAYLELTPVARTQLSAQGKSAEGLLEEQLRLMTDGASQALRQDYSAADRLLAQSRFLQERFGSGELRLDTPEMPR